MRIILRRFDVLTVAISLITAVPAAAQTLVRNPGFEEARDSAGVPLPAGWRTGASGYEIRLDTAERLAGRASLRMSLVAPAPAGRAAGRFAMAAQALPAEAAHGRILRLAGWIRTEGVAQGHAGLWIRSDGPRPVVALGDMSRVGATGTTPWTRYVLELPVDSSVTALAVGVFHRGTGTAWFDSLTLEVGRPLPRRAGRGEYRPPPRPSEDFTRLLDDAELAVPPDPGAPAENAAWRGWVREHARPVRSLGAADMSDLRFLAPLLGGKRIVQVGESSHGVAEFNRAKVRLIRYLHEELGYDVIAFESGLFECDRAGQEAAFAEPEQVMRDCTLPVWHTHEVLPLFEYIRETQRTPRPLVLTGFDVQRTSERTVERPAFLARVVAAAGDTAYARVVRETDSAVVHGGRGIARRNRRELVAFYDSLAAWLRPREAVLSSAFPDDPAAPVLARQLALSTALNVRQLAIPADATDQERIEIRDRGMANNLEFVLNELHPGKKVIVWAHNEHVRHRGYGDSVPPGAALPDRRPRTMGSWVAERHRAELYTIGMFMYRGSTATNSGLPRAVTRATPGSLESILHGAPWRYAFVDLSRAQPGPGAEWMVRRIAGKWWGTTPEPIVPRRDYDGILFIDTTWPPEYIR
ncbi:MAG TPA: erythromycin esterase family protein [Longimicrobium sp.]|nr:erythromycin esterase family protein [Longimicrobium sp.]